MASIPAPCSASRRGFSSKPLRAYTLSFDHAEYDERAIAAATGGASGAEFYPSTSALRPLADHFGRRALPCRAAVRERARGREVHAQPRGARSGHQGRADRRGQRRDLRRLSALPPRLPALRRRTARIRRTRPAAGRARGVEQGLGGNAACRRRRWRLESVQRVLGFVPSILEIVGADRARPAEASSSDGFRAEFAGRDTFRVAARTTSTSSASSPAASRSTSRSTSGPRRAAQLHPEQSGRPDGDGALGRRPAAVPRSPRRRGSGTDAGLDEDPRA